MAQTAPDGRRRPSLEQRLSIRPENRWGQNPGMYRATVYEPGMRPIDGGTNSIGQRLPDKECPSCAAELQRVDGIWRCPWARGGQPNEYSVLGCGRPYSRRTEQPLGAEAWGWGKL